jgi:hypothetical protein
MSQSSYPVQYPELPNQGNPYMNPNITFPQTLGPNMQVRANPVRTVPDNLRKNPTCFYCKLRGHFYDDCPQRLEDVTNNCLKSEAANFFEAKRSFFRNRFTRARAEPVGNGMAGTESDASVQSVRPANQMMRIIPDGNGQYGPERGYTSETRMQILQENERQTNLQKIKTEVEKQGTSANSTTRKC